MSVNTTVRGPRRASAVVKPPAKPNTRMPAADVDADRKALAVHEHTVAVEDDELDRSRHSRPRRGDVVYSRRAATLSLKADRIGRVRVLVTGL